jgi:hypothetical protein
MSRSPIFSEKGVKLSLLLVVFLPPVMFLLLNATSMALGLITASSVIFLSAYFIACAKPITLVFSRELLLYAYIVFLLIFVHYLLSQFVVSLEQDGIRFLASLVSMVTIISAALAVSMSLKEVKQSAVKSAIYTISLILVFNAIMSLTGVDYFGVRSNKLTFLFNEPSHFAIVTAPFLIYYIKSRSSAWLFMLLLFLGFSIYIENMTMLIAVLLSVLVGFRLTKIMIFFLVILISILGTLDTNYFVSRLVFSVDESNLSGLVFLQGWQNSYLTLVDTYGWGCGFQQFGIASTAGEITQKIQEVVHGESLNLLDGGTTASKLIGEFGVFGIFVVSIFVVRAIQAFRFIRKNESISSLTLLTKCVEISFLIELFIRGVGYFSPTIFLYLVVYFCSKMTSRIELKSSQ